MRKVFLVALLIFLLISPLYAAPCYGTKLPGKDEIFMGLQSHAIFKRHLEDDFGKLRSAQYFFLLSYGVFERFSIDLKVGLGNIKVRPLGGDEVDYDTNFAGGYGFRLKLLDRKRIKAVFGFQHISVHPKSTHLDTVKNKAILDDWQASLLASYDFKKFTPYLGTRWSRVDYIHRQGENRGRRMSDSSKDIGLIVGIDLPFTKKVWINLEGNFFDSTAAAFSVNYAF